MISSFVLEAVFALIVSYNSWIMQPFPIIFVDIGIILYAVSLLFAQTVWFANFVWEQKVIVVTGKGRFNGFNVRMFLVFASFYSNLVRLIMHTEKIGK